MFILNPYRYSAAGSYLLDTYTGSTVAYSLRKLKASATNCVRVRRASDNAEQDIGFVSGVIDVSSMETFCSGTDGFVTVWYDQNGSIDASRVVTADQPRIVVSGTTEVDPNNGNYSVNFQSTDFLELVLAGTTTPTSIATTQLFYQSHVVNRPSTGITTVGLANKTVGTSYVYFWWSADQMYSAMGTQTLHDSSQTQTGDFLITTLRDSSNNVKIWRNAGALTTKTYADGTGVLNVLGTRVGNQNVSHMQELIYWNSDQESNRSGIETDTNSYYSIW